MADRMDYRHTYAAWAEAFTIFAKYEQDYANTATDHDVFYAGGPIKGYSLTDIRRLYKLGWMIDKNNDSFFHFT